MENILESLQSVFGGFELTIESGQLNIAPDVLFYVGQTPITNSFTSGILLTLLIVLFVAIFSSVYQHKGVPSKLQLALESGYEMLIDFLTLITNSEKISRKILPIITTLFVYIALANLMPVLPIYDSITFDSAVTGDTVTFFRGHTLELSVTLGIAIAMILGTLLAGSSELGPFGYIRKRFALDEIVHLIKTEMPKGPGGFVMAIVQIVVLLFVSLLDLVSDIFKSISLALRLLVNVFAGQLLVVLVYGLLALLAVPLLIYGMITGLIQALVFAALTASYFSSSMQE